jgi:hypothetical protein
MEFEFDPAKSESNKLKHGIDLTEAQKLWTDQHLIEGPGHSHTEHRWLAVGVIDGIHWTACYTHRGERIRIIECRRARHEERIVYELGK